MGFIELVFTVCLAADPEVCREERESFVQDASLVGCMVRAQPYLAGWEATHPRWAVTAWRCAQPGPREREA